MATTGELEEHKQQVKIQLDTRLKALIKIKKEHCRIAIKMSKKATNVTPQPQPFTIQQVSAEVYIIILHKLLCLGIKVYIYIIRSVLH